MNKKQLSERDICTKFITPALRQAGWNEMTQLREEVSFTKGRIIVPRNFVIAPPLIFDVPSMSFGDSFVAGKTLIKHPW